MGHGRRIFFVRHEGRRLAALPLSFGFEKSENFFQEILFCDRGVTRALYNEAMLKNKPESE